MKSETCARCGQEVRRGYRGGRLAWWHKDDQPPALTITRREGHEPVFGNAARPLLSDVIGSDNKGEPDDRIFDIPPPEVYAIPIDIEDAEKLPGGAKNLIKAVRRAGGRAVATYSRAARVHSAHGNFLGMSDWVVVKFERDGRRAVARWCDGALDVAYIMHYGRDSIYPEKTDSKGLRAWMLKWHGPHQEVS